MASSISKFPPSLGIVKSTLIGGIFLVAANCAQADLNSNSTPNLKKKPTPSGSIQPSAVADVASAEVSRAGEVVIRLRGIARGGGQIEFKLQQKPLHGRIISSKPVGLDSLDVTYRHSGDQRSDTDSFIFAVRAGSTGPFSPGEAKIRIIDQPGRLLAPESLPFPATLVGQTAIDSFVVLNEGGETLSGKITVTPPWHLKETPAYYLEAGEKRKITVLFVPTSSGNFTGSLIFEGTKPTSVDLQGEGLGTFQVSPAKIKLVPTLDGKRSGIVSVQNNTQENLTVELTSRLDLPKTVTLQFGETKEITIEDTGISPLNTYITFQNGSYTTRVDVTADEAITPSQPTPSPASTAPVVTSSAPTPVNISPNSSRPTSSASDTPPEETATETPVPTPRSTTPGKFISAKIIRLSHSTIRIDWDLLPASSKARYSIQQRYLFLDGDKKLITQWVEVPTAQIVLSEKTGTATIDDLDANTAFTFRVQQTFGENTPYLISQPLLYKTEPGFFRRLTWRSFLLPIGAIMIGLVLWKRWRERDTSS